MKIIVLIIANWHGKKGLEYSEENSLRFIWHYNRFIWWSYIIYPKWVLGECKHRCKNCMYKDECYTNLPLKPIPLSYQTKQDIKLLVSLFVILIAYVIFFAWLIYVTVNL